MEAVALNALSPGDGGTITGLTGLPAMTRQRLLEMGITRGVHVRFVRRAPLGDPIEIHLKGYRLMLRGTEARCIMIQKEGGA
jgi:Fe2+ transport system protein FeoA